MDQATRYVLNFVIISAVLCSPRSVVRKVMKCLQRAGSKYLRCTTIFSCFSECSILKAGRKLLVVWEVPETTCLRMVCRAFRIRGREARSSARGHHLPSQAFRPVGCIRRHIVPPCSPRYHLHPQSLPFQQLVSIFHIFHLRFSDQIGPEELLNYHSFFSCILKFNNRPK